MYDESYAGTQTAVGKACQCLREINYRHADVNQMTISMICDGVGTAPDAA